MAQYVVSKSGLEMLDTLHALRLGCPIRGRIGKRSGNSEPWLQL